MATIRKLSALEILDSRGRPTVKARCELAGGAVGAASVPSGASTGAAEALELRDGDPGRYGGLGCRRAAGHVNEEIARAVCGSAFDDQTALDEALVRLDGTENKSRLGANAILATSIAFARACAVEAGVPLYRHFAAMVGQDVCALPRLTVNLFSGGKHAGGQVPIQDLLVVPAAGTIDGGLAQVYAVYQAAAGLILRKYQMRSLAADEGGLAPAFGSLDAIFEDAVQAIGDTGLAPGRDVWLALDVAGSHFFRDGRYHLPGGAVDAAGMVETIAGWVERYPIVSVEDGLSEGSWADWPGLRRRLGGRALTLGDDFLCTNPQRIRRAIDGGCADALLLKVNQIGTLSDAAEARRLAKAAGWRVTISARSGETEDDWLADMAVGWGGDQIKVGSITRSERLAKYNRLLEIEGETGLPVVAWP